MNALTLYALSVTVAGAIVSAAIQVIPVQPAPDHFQTFISGLPSILVSLGTLAAALGALYLSWQAGKKADATGKKTQAIAVDTEHIKVATNNTLSAAQQAKAIAEAALLTKDVEIRVLRELIASQDKAKAVADAVAVPTNAAPAGAPLVAAALPGAPCP